MFPAISRRKAPASPLTAEQTRNRFWWGMARPKAKHRKIMFAVLAVEAAWLAVMVGSRVLS
ncbi:hypothetical protein [Croceicoccus gelatinilyticus]|uniref:hypothetical protein n=1 Tax=Croceicoccus gelatinilyticus TaxID=2835536 RepID=UPI001BD0DBCC|nr:hypothetical protein [Croceicoccus gelatinilyticus]MBS7668844.1 hypothetical protein [Croceicoccus gelatinilyticus]